MASAVIGAPPAAYDRHVGRYGGELAAAMIRFADVQPGQRVLDVGCGPGALAVGLASLLGAENVAAIDPSEGFVEVCRERIPGADVRLGCAERLPFADRQFDAVLAQLVIDGLDDPAQGVAEMRRVARRSGVVAACVWDVDGGMPLLHAVQEAVMEIDPERAGALGVGERLPFTRPAELESLWRSSGLEAIQLRRGTAGADYADFDDLWYPFAAGVGKLGAFARSLDEPALEALRRNVRRRLGSPDGPFRLTAAAWSIRGRRAS